ncbi:hypothetical protein JW964_19730 [candidate division KSB1 bacterium]|nr:hypothetical protein [candidate division KSB1 bacterium]
MLISQLFSFNKNVISCLLLSLLVFAVPTQAQPQRVNERPIPIPIPAPSNPQLEFTIDDGYGLDKNHNGIIDMPNSSEYVQRPLKVKFSLKGISQFQPNTSSPSPINNPATPAIFRYVWRWTFYPEADVRQNISHLPIPKAFTTNQNIKGKKYSDRLITYSSGFGIDIDLFEGSWKVQISKVNSNDLNGSPIETYDFKAQLEDYLIVQLGDSYSSGEGAPELNNTVGIWGDDGTDELFGVRLYRDYDNECMKTAKHLRSRSITEITSTLKSLHNDFPNILDDLCSGLNCALKISFSTKENIQHEVAHRSSKTWGSIAALKVEKYSQQSSVTFLNLAMSGARTKHVVDNSKKGIQPILLNFPYFDYAKVLTPDCPALKNSMPSQTEQLKSIIGNRKIDALFISIGGNDVGFKNVITAYIIREPDGIAPGDPPMDDIKSAIRNGDWRHIGGLKTKLADWFKSDVDFSDILPGLDGLDRCYYELNEKLESLGVDPQNVYITEYPNPIIQKKPNGNGYEVCNTDILTSIADGKEIKPGEMERILSDFIEPINIEIGMAARTYNWNLVKTGDVMYGFPICSENRMMKRYKESAETQGDESGALHPNESGYAAMAQKLLQQLRLPHIR